MSKHEITFGEPYHPSHPDTGDESPIQRHFVVEGVGYGTARVVHDLGILPGVRATFTKLIDDGEIIISRGWVDSDHTALTVVTYDELLDTALRERFDI